MPNYAGISAVLTAAFHRPGLVVPHLTIPTITSLSWEAAKSSGVRFVVFDKDNCLTKPHSDQLEPTLSRSYQECIDVFGRDNVLIVSNSAGSSSDLGGIGAQHLSRVLYGTTVLCHPAEKPAKHCASQVVDHFTTLPPNQASSPSTRTPLRRLFSAKPVQGSEGRTTSHVASAKPGDVLVIGDRITTDTVLCHRISDVLAKRYASQSPPPRAISILTTTLWANEGILNNIMRKAETSIRNRLVRRGIAPGATWKRPTNPTTTPDYASLLIAQHPQPFHASSLSALPKTRSTPTLTNLLVSSLYTTPLPPLVKRILASLLTNRFTQRTLHFCKDGWFLILRGVREGLTRPDLVLGTNRKIHSRSRPKYNTRISPTLPGSRAYSTQSPPPEAPRRNWPATLAALAIIPIGVLGGVYLHDWWYGAEIEGTLVKASREAEEEAQRQGK